MSHPWRKPFNRAGLIRWRKERPDYSTAVVIRFVKEASSRARLFRQRSLEFRSKGGIVSKLRFDERNP